MSTLRFTDPRPGPAPRRACVATRSTPGGRRPWRRPVELFICRGCGKLRPWSEGGDGDPRCDHCVAAARATP